MVLGNWLCGIPNPITLWSFLTLSLPNEAADQMCDLKLLERVIPSHGLQKEQRTWLYKGACSSGTL